MTIGKRIESLVKPLAGIVIGAYIRPKKANGPIPLDEIDNLLLLRNDALGDAIVTTPVWRTLKRLKPGLRIGVVASSHNIQLLETDPDIDQLFLLDPKRPDKNVEREIAATQWDVVMCFLYNSKTSSAMLAKRLAPHAYSSVVAFKDFDRYRRYFSIVSLQSREDNPHMTEIIRKHLLDTIRLDDKIEEWHPDLVLPDALSLSVKNTIFGTLGPAIQNYIHINLHASVSDREWGYLNSLALADKLHTELPDTGIVFTAAPNRFEEAAANLPLTQGVMLYKTASQLELIAVTRHSSLVVTPDTSVTHIASAEKKPVVALHYRTNEWYPYEVPNKVLMKPSNGVVKNIPVSIVRNAVIELLP